MSPYNPSCGISFLTLRSEFLFLTAKNCKDRPAVHLWFLLALLFGLVNRFLEFGHCGDRRRIQHVLAHVTPDGGRIERVFSFAKINFETIFGRAGLILGVRTSILRPRTGTADRGRTTLLGADANVAVLGLQNHGTIVNR